MNLVHVKGNTYYIDAWEAIPVYVKENRDCILLDSGCVANRRGRAWV